MVIKPIVIVGPTCSGKTELSISLAEKLSSEIISADSRQIYKHLSIGTAKPTSIETSKVKHHLIDFLEPNINYNVSKFEKETLAKILGLLKKDQTPIVVGGSGLYIKAIVDGIFDTVDTDVEYRNQLMEEKEEFGNEYILERLKEVDPKSAQKLISQNWKRIIRALEVYKITGKPIWQLQQEYKRDVQIEFRQYGLNWERETLYENINARVDKMIDDGLVNEVESILDMGFQTNINALNTVGYKEIIEYLNEKISLERAIELIKRNTRHYAKRQLTWFRKDARIKWFDVKRKKDFLEIADIISKES